MVSRKAEVVSIRAHAHPTRIAKTTLVRSKTEEDISAPPMQPENDNEQPWQLIHDDPFDRTKTDDQIRGVVDTIAARSAAPYREVVRLLAGVDDLDEAEARAFFERIVEHRARLSRMLAREVHVRVAALDMMTSRPASSTPRRDSHPIVVTSSMLEKALEEATLDSLTGLPQRAQFTSLLRHELRQRKRRSVVVAYLDLDGFKAVNDRYGHARGDEVLQTLARSARHALRTGDVLARLGGDEFGVLLLDVTLVEADAVLARLRDRFEELTAPLGTSFSVGFALAHGGETPSAVLMRADESMYRQKKKRRAALG